MRNGPVLLLSGPPAWLPLLLACVAFHSKQWKGSFLSKQWKLIKSLTNIFNQALICRYKYEYFWNTIVWQGWICWALRAWHWTKVGPTKEIALLERMKSCCVLHWHWPCMDFVKFELRRSWRPAPESPVSKSQNLLWEVPPLISAAHMECWQLCLLCHNLGSAVSHGAVCEAERTWRRNFSTCSP